MPTAEHHCRVCGSDTDELTTIHSNFSNVDFLLRRCDACGLVFVANPRTDFASVYDAAYYHGRGADPLTNYVREMGNADTIHAYEWGGVARAVQHLCASTTVAWLDFGCGLGGLVRYARTHGFANIFGYDQGWAADWAREHGVEVLDETQLGALTGSFDVVTAIEVLEHVPEPLQAMGQIASLLKPGGVLFLTTGNAAPHRGSFSSWRYVVPDLHVSYFEPRTLIEAYRRVGLEPLPVGYLPGHDGIIRYKVLKTLGTHSTNLIERLVPWRFASRVVDWRHRVSEQPLARKPHCADGSH
jgi:SAM-dependent methyltransferase